VENNPMKQLLLFVSLILVSRSNAQSSTTPDTSVAGVWKGTSICQVKPSPCHDEVVVYHISPGKKPQEFNIIMNKIVNGVEEEMGAIPATYDLRSHKLTGIMKNYPAWNFVVKGKVMDGTLLLQDGTLYRIIHVQKQ
jgi:hypothetical protein